MQHSRTVDGLHNKPEKPNQKIREKIAVVFQQLAPMMALGRNGHRSELVSMKCSILGTYIIIRISVPVRRSTVITFSNDSFGRRL